MGAPNGAKYAKAHYPVLVYDTDDNRADRTNILALASVALGTLAMGSQSLGCCLPVVAPMVVFTIGCMGLALGIAGYRQSEQSNLNGFTPAVVGITLGVMNTFM
ncbi:MAG: hypothetical protein ACJAZO_000737, partial [Myxococcota bacterium]